MDPGTSKRRARERSNKHANRDSHTNPLNYSLARPVRERRKVKFLRMLRKVLVLSSC